MSTLAANLSSLLGSILLIASIVYLFSVGLDVLAIARQGTKRIRDMDVANAPAAEIARSGGKTLLAIIIGFAAFGIAILLFVLPLKAGVPAEDLVVVQIVRGFWNLTIGAVLDIPL